MMTATCKREPARQQSKQKSVWVRIVDPVIGDHWIRLPVGNLCGGVDVRVLVIMHLLPTTVDVAKDIGRVERVNKKSDQAEDSSKRYDEVRKGFFIAVNDPVAS